MKSSVGSKYSWENNQPAKPGEAPKPIGKVREKEFKVTTPAAGSNELATVEEIGDREVSDDEAAQSAEPLYRAGAEVRLKGRGRKSTTMVIDDVGHDQDGSFIYHGKVSNSGASKGASTTARQDEIDGEV